MSQEQQTVVAAADEANACPPTEFTRLRGWAFYGALAVLSVAALYVALSTAAELPSRVTRWDFSHYYLSALSLHRGNNPYTSSFAGLAAQLGLQADEIDRATYPPTFLLLIEPLTLLPERAAYWVWQTVNVLLFLSALLLLLRGSDLDWPYRAGLLALALLYAPVQYHFYFGQAEIPLLFLFALTMYLMERGKDAGAGLCLALAGLIKLFPLLLIGYLVFQKRWRILLWVGIGLVAGGLATLGRFGLTTVLSYVSAVLFVTGQRWIGLTWNVSVYAVTSRLVWMIAGDHLASHAEWVRRGAGLVAELSVLYFTVSRTVAASPTEESEWRIFSLWIVASVLLSPTAWVHYMVLFLILFARIAIAGTFGRLDPGVRSLALAGYLLLIPSVRPLLVFAVRQVVRHFGTEVAGGLVRGVGALQFISAAVCFLAAYYFVTERKGNRGEAGTSLTFR